MRPAIAILKGSGSNSAATPSFASLYRKLTSFLADVFPPSDNPQSSYPPSSVNEFVVQRFAAAPDLHRHLSRELWTLLREISRDEQQVNGKALAEYFTTLRDLRLAKKPLELLETPDMYDIWVKVEGGGPHGQAGAVQLGVARALKEVNPVMFEQLRENGLLTRDSRMKERKKPGRRGARRGFQFSKR